MAAAQDRGGGDPPPPGPATATAATTLVHESESNVIRRAVVPWSRLTASAAAEALAGGGRGRPAASSASSSDAAAAATASASVAVAIKSLACPSNPSAEDLSCLHNEYNVLTRHLSGCPAARRALGVERRPPSEGGPAVLLEWAEGRTLQEWMDERGDPPPPPPPSSRRRRSSTAAPSLVRMPSRSRRRRKRREGKGGGGGDADGDDSSGDDGGDDDRYFTASTDERSEETAPDERAWRDDLLLRCRVARELAEALAQVHGAGVVHNDVFADNVVVSFEGGGSEGEDDGRDTTTGTGTGTSRKYSENSKTSQDTAKHGNKNKNGGNNVRVRIIDFGFASLSAGNDLTDYDLHEDADSANEEEAQDEDGEGGGGGGSCNDDIYALGNVLRDLFLGKGGRLPALMGGGGGGGGGPDMASVPPGVLAPPSDRNRRDNLQGLSGELFRASTASLGTRTSRCSSLLSSSLPSTSRSSLLSSSTTTMGGRTSSVRSCGAAAVPGGRGRLGSADAGARGGGGGGGGGGADESRRRSSFILADELGVPTYHQAHQADCVHSGSDSDDDEDGEGGDGWEVVPDGAADEDGGNDDKKQPRSPKRQRGRRRANGGAPPPPPLPPRSRVPQAVSDLISNLMVSTGGPGGGCPFGVGAGGGGGGGSFRGGVGGTDAPLVGVAVEPYRSARDLRDDLDQMLSDPDTFLFDEDDYADVDVGGAEEEDDNGDGDGGGPSSSPPPPKERRIEIPEGRLYGKDSEISSLVDAYVRIVDGGKSECVLVSGPAGTGKSTLIRALRRPAVRRGGYFVSGKFDQLRGDEPYSALISGFEDFCGVVLGRGPDAAAEMGREIEAAVGAQGTAALAEIVPGLADVVAAGRRGEGASAAAAGGDGQRREKSDDARPRGRGRGSAKRRSSFDESSGASDASPERGAPPSSDAARTGAAADASSSTGSLRRHLEKTSSAANGLSAGGDSSVASAAKGPKRRSSATKSDFSSNRMHRAFRMFARAISAPDRPVVLALDDLQWADAASLDLVRSLVTDPDNASFLFVGSYRDDEVPSGHPLRSFLREVEKMEREAEEDGNGGADGRGGGNGGGGGGGVTRIPVGNLDLDSANSLVSESLRLTRRVTRPLAEIIHRKTHGNVLFFLQFLRSFRDEGLLYYNDDLRRWKWDLDRARTSDPADNVAGLLADKIRGLPGEAREVVQLAACLGSYFDGGTLRRLVADLRRSGDDIGINSGTGARGNILDDVGGLGRVLRSLIAEGMIDRVPERGAGGDGSSKYKFSHDRVQQAAYSLVPEEERGRLHLRIGNLILAAASASSASASSSEPSAPASAASDASAAVLLFTAVDQLNRGTDRLTTQAERYEVAELNLRAGERAMQSSAFGPAASYLRRGIDLLGESTSRHWSERYELSLGLFCALSEAECCNCRFAAVDAVAGEVLERARTADDATPAYRSLMKSHGARGNNAEAASLGFDVLERLGEKFPRPNVSRAHVLRDVARTKLALRGKTDDDLASLPAASDLAKVSAMQLLTSMFAYGHYVNPAYGFLVANRMVRLSLQHGACDESAFGFASYACVLCCAGDLGGGVRFGNLALSLVHRFDAREWIAHVYAIAHSTSLHWRLGLRRTLDPFLYSCRAGLEAGDNEYAMYGIMDYCHHSFYCGRPLEHLEEELGTYCRQMAEYSQDAPRALTLPYWQAVLNLMGRSADPTRLTGDAMDRDLLAGEAEAKGNLLVASVISHLSQFLAYTFGNYDLAEELSERCAGLASSAGAMFITYCQEFYRGLLCFALARSESSSARNRKRWAKRGRKSAGKVAAWAKICPSNWRHKSLLLEAEGAALGGKPERAAALFDGAVQAANAAGFIHEEALAYERGGVHFAEGGLGRNDRMASRYFARSQELYLVWGAKAKAELLRTQYTSLVVPGRRRRSFQVFKKRRCAGRMTAHVSPNGIF